MTNRILLGNPGGAGMTFRVSKPGLATSSTALGDYLIHESKPLTKVLFAGAVSTLAKYFDDPVYVSTIVGRVIYRYTLTHNLGYVPSFAVDTGTYGISVGVDNTSLFINVQYDYNNTTPQPNSRAIDSVSFQILNIEVP